MKRTYKYFIAKSIKGAEFSYSKQSAFYVPTSSKDVICESLNYLKWNLKPNEVWHIHEADWYTESFIDKAFRRVRKNNTPYIQVIHI